VGRVNARGAGTGVLAFDRTPWGLAPPREIASACFNDMAAAAAAAVRSAAAMVGGIRPRIVGIGQGVELSDRDRGC